MSAFATLIIALLGQAQAISKPTVELKSKDESHHFTPILKGHRGHAHEEALKSEEEEQLEPLHVVNHEDDKKRVFYAISMGSLASRHQMRLFVSSLKEVGHWKGDIVLITDKPSCLEKNLAPLLGTKLATSKDADTFDLDGESKLIFVKVADAKGDTRTMKIEKTKVWKNLKKAGIEYPVSSVVYMDSDIVVGKDLSEFMSYVHKLEKKDHSLALFRDTGATAGQLHTGVVVMFPNQANKRCLKAWGEAIAEVRAVQRADHSAKYTMARDPQYALNHKLRLMAKKAEVDSMQLDALTGPDQRALMGTKQCRKADGIKIMDHKFFSLPTAKDLKSDDQPQFVHFTNTHRWHMISDVAKEEFFYGKLGLSKSLDALNNEETCAPMKEQKGYRMGDTTPEEDNQ